MNAKSFEGHPLEDTYARKQLENKITAPEEPAVGKILKVKAVNEDGSFTVEWADGGSGNIEDVTVDSTSIVNENGVAEVPTLVGNAAGTTSHGYGLVKYDPNGYGIGVNNKGIAVIREATSSTIKNRSGVLPIVPRNFDVAVKSAMCDPIGSTALNVAWTEEEQIHARERLGIGDWELIADVTLEEDTDYVFEKNDEFALSDFKTYYIIISGKERSTPVGKIYVAFKTNKVQMDSVKRWYVGSTSDAGDRSITRMYADFSMVNKNEMNDMSYTNVIGCLIDGYGNFKRLTTESSKFIGQENPFNLYVSSAGAGTNIKIYGIRSSSTSSSFKYTDAYINSLIENKLNDIDGSEVMY